MQQIHDLIIIGGGITGLTAAVCAGAAELDVLVIDRNPKPGGSLLKEQQIQMKLLYGFAVIFLFPKLTILNPLQRKTIMLLHCRI